MPLVLMLAGMIVVVLSMGCCSAHNWKRSSLNLDTLDLRLSAFGAQPDEAGHRAPDRARRNDVRDFGVAILFALRTVVLLADQRSSPVSATRKRTTISGAFSPRSTHRPGW